MIAESVSYRQGWNLSAFIFTGLEFHFTIIRLSADMKLKKLQALSSHGPLYCGFIVKSSIVTSNIITSSIATFA